MSLLITLLKTLKKRICIGILGGGQLARMSAFQAYKLGFDIAILEKKKNSPAGQLTHNEFVGWVDDKTILKKFAEHSDVITLENEFIDYTYLEFLEKFGKKVIPSSKTISLIQDKLIQKRTLRKYGIPVADFVEVRDEDLYSRIAENLGNKFILKSRKMGYDGYGNETIENGTKFQEAFKKLTKRHSKLLAEEFIDFKMELAVMVVRSKKEIKTYPVVQTIQKEHICHTVIAPAEIPNIIVKKIKEIAIDCIKAIKGYGIFGVELFLTKNDKILVNELAPRTHNSGHYTIEGCKTSQFENHLRAILNLPLGSTELVKSSAVMINLLGKKVGFGIIDNYKAALEDPEVKLHIYGKEKSRIGRKMGHITVIGDQPKKILKKAIIIEEKIII